MFVSNLLEHFILRTELELHHDLVLDVRVHLAAVQFHRAAHDGKNLKNYFEK